MPLVTVDTSVALPAMLSPTSHPRKLFVVLAYGAVGYRAEHLRLDLHALKDLAEAEGGSVHGIDVLEQMVERAERRRAVLAELLPFDAPSDWHAVGFSTLFDEFARKLREAGSRLDPTIREQDMLPLRRQFETVCIAGPPPFDPTDVPGHTRDPNDDAIVHGALLADSDFLISDDRDIVPGGEAHDYEHDGHRTRAVTFRHFTREHFRPRDFGWPAVDGSWLRMAFDPGD